jgi:hypothetical protein
MISCFNLWIGAVANQRIGCGVAAHQMVISL